MCQMEGPLVSPLLLVQPQGEPNSLLAGPAVPWGWGSLSPQQPLSRGLFGVTYHVVSGAEAWLWP